MVRVGGVLAIALAAALTPGAALALLQQWGPVIVLAAGMAGGAAATAVMAYRKALENGRRIAKLERHIPKRSTDRPPV